MKKILSIVVLLMGLCGVWFAFAYADTPPPTYDDNFSSHLISDADDNTVYTISKINPHNSLKTNIQCLLYPNHASLTVCGSSPGGVLWDVARNIMVAVVFIFLVVVGARLLVSNPDSEKDKIKDALKSLYYIALGALLFFGAVWILGTLLNFWAIEGTKTVVAGLQWGTGSLFYRAIALLKTLVFFIAIVMMVVYGFRIISAVDKADEAKKHLRGILNIIIALILIKVIDYVYYIAQAKSFADEAQDFILSIAKILWFAIGAGAIVMVFYAWYLLLTDQGKSENMKKAKNIFLNILLIALVIFIFLLIIYQIFAEFA